MNGFAVLSLPQSAAQSSREDGWFNLYYIGNIVTYNAILRQPSFSELLVNETVKESQTGCCRRNHVQQYRKLPQDEQAE